jgi:hypothetical protein
MCATPIQREKNIRSSRRVPRPLDLPPQQLGLQGDRENDDARPHRTRCTKPARQLLAAPKRGENARLLPLSRNVILARAQHAAFTDVAGMLKGAMRE